MNYDKTINTSIPRSFFDSLPLNQQVAIIDKFVKAAQQGIRELHVDGSGNTIVHDVVHLHSDHLFRLVFKEGSPFLNALNAQGATPLLAAVMENDEALVAELLKANVSDSINRPNLKGVTPLHAAIASDNYQVASLVLNHGAQASIAASDDRGMTPLHLAVLSKNSAMVELLLKFGASDTIDTADLKGLTPWQRAIICGNGQAVKLMLSVKPESANSLNEPDQYGVTDLQRAARSGNMEIMGLLRDLYVKEDIRINPDASLTAGDLVSCLAPDPKNLILSIPLDAVAFPLTIAQNVCNVMVRLKNGKILKIPNADAGEVRTFLMESKYGPQQPVESNILTLYLSPGHGFMRLECEKCNDGKPYNENLGFYPSSRKPSEEIKKEEVKSLDVAKADVPAYDLEWLASGALLVPKVLVGGLALPVVLTGKAALYSDWTKERVLHFGDILKDQGIRVKKTLGWYKREAIKLYEAHIYNAYRMSGEQVGELGRDELYESDSDAGNLLKIMFYVSNDQAKAVVDLIKQTAASCETNPGQSCVYHLFKHNCVDFMQDVFKKAGGAGDFIDYITDEQLGHGHLDEPSQLFKFKAMEYGLIRSRGLPQYLKTHVHQVLGLKQTDNVIVENSGYNNSPMANEVLGEGSVALTNQGNPHVPTVPVINLTVPQLGLAAVLGVLAVKSFNYMSKLWCQSIGVKATAEEFSHWHDKAVDELEKLTQQFNVIETEIDKQLIEINDQIDSEEKNADIEDENASIITSSGIRSLSSHFIIDLLQQERRQWTKLSHELIDMYFEGFEIEKELKTLNQGNSLPSKAYLEQIQVRLEKLKSWKQK